MIYKVVQKIQNPSRLVIALLGEIGIFFILMRSLYWPSKLLKSYIFIRKKKKNIFPFQFLKDL